MPEYGWLDRLHWKISAVSVADEQCEAASIWGAGVGDFEKTLAKEFSPDYPDLEKTEAFKSLHVVLIELWRLLNENGTYPYMVKALPEY